MQELKPETQATLQTRSATVPTACDPCKTKQQGFISACAVSSHLQTHSQALSANTCMPDLLQFYHTCSNAFSGTEYRRMTGLLGSLTIRYLPSSSLRQRSMTALTMPQQFSMCRLICMAKSLGLHTCKCGVRLNLSEHGIPSNVVLLLNQGTHWHAVGDVQLHCELYRKLHHELYQKTIVI